MARIAWSTGALSHVRRLCNGILGLYANSFLTRKTTMVGVLVRKWRASGATLSGMRRETNQEMYQDSRMVNQFWGRRLGFRSIYYIFRCCLDGHCNGRRRCSRYLCLRPLLRSCRPRTCFSSCVCCTSSILRHSPFHLFSPQSARLQDDFEANEPAA